MIGQFCGKCGKVNTAQMNFCLECGQSLVVENQTPPVINPPTQFSPNQVQQNFSPSNFSSPSSYTPFQEKDFQSLPASYTPFQQNFDFQSGATPPAKFEHPAPPMPLSETVSGQKKGAGGKIISILGVLGGSLFLILKFGVVFLRVGKFGIVGFAIVGGIVVVVVAVGFILKRGSS